MIILGCDLMQKKINPFESTIFISHHPTNDDVMLGSLSDGSDRRDLLHSKILDKARKKAKKDGMDFLKALKIVIKRHGFIPKVL